MKKQFNFYLDSRCKEYFSDIRSFDKLHYEGLSDSQIVEKLIFEKRYSLDPSKKVDILGLCDDPYCPECHKQFDDKENGSKFCSRCGTPLDWSFYYRLEGK